MSENVLIDGVKRFSSWAARAKQLPRFQAALELQLQQAQSAVMQRDEYIAAVDSERSKVVEFVRLSGYPALGDAIERGEHLR